MSDRCASALPFLPSMTHDQVLWVVALSFCCKAFSIIRSPKNTDNLDHTPRRLSKRMVAYQESSIQHFRQVTTSIRPCRKALRREFNSLLVSDGTSRRRLTRLLRDTGRKQSCRPHAHEDAFEISHHILRIPFAATSPQDHIRQVCKC